MAITYAQLTEKFETSRVVANRLLKEMRQYGTVILHLVKIKIMNTIKLDYKRYNFNHERKFKHICRGFKKRF